MGPGPAKTRVTSVEMTAATTAGPKKTMLNEPMTTSRTNSVAPIGVL